MKSCHARDDIMSCQGHCKHSEGVSHARMPEWHRSLTTKAIRHWKFIFHRHYELFPYTPAMGHSCRIRREEMESEEMGIPSPDVVSYSTAMSACAKVPVDQMNRERSSKSSTPYGSTATFSGTVSAFDTFT